MSKSGILKQVKKVLKDAGFDVYYPGQHKGECKSPYIVVKADGSVQSIAVSSERPIYTIMCYVPNLMYTELEDMGNKARETLRKVFPLVMYVGNETPSVYDETVKAHMVSFQYQGCRKIINW